MMDIEQLTKAQIVLLTLLVSFITSIATGIVTVSLMDQAPESMTQVINRVVERTVERVVPSDVQLAGAGASGDSTVKEVTVVVKENDLITEAIEKNTRSFVRISKKPDSRSQGPTGTFVGLGFFVKSEGLVATDPALVSTRESYVVTTHTGEHYSAKVTVDGEEATVALLQVDQGTSTASFPTVTFADPASVKLGQTAISLSGENRVAVALGIITDIETAEETGALVRIRTDMADSRAGYGSPLFNMFGETIGIHTTQMQTPGTASYAPLPALSTLVAAQAR